jgi:hypothetical protein
VKKLLRDRQPSGNEHICDRGDYHQVTCSPEFNKRLETVEQKVRRLLNALRERFKRLQQEM